MRIKYLLLAACLILSAPALSDDASPAKDSTPKHAASGKDAPASDASIRELLELSNAKQLLESVRVQVNRMMEASMRQATQGKEISPDKQAVLDDMRTQMLAVFDEMMSWDKLQDLYMRTYRASFTQGEIDGIIKFYKTPAGKALINKLPVIMQNVMTEVQGMLQPMQQKLMKIQQDAMQKLKSQPAE